MQYSYKRMLHFLVRERFLNSLSYMKRSVHTPILHIRFQTGDLMKKFCKSVGDDCLNWQMIYRTDIKDVRHVYSKTIYHALSQDYSHRDIVSPRVIVLALDL